MTNHSTMRAALKGAFAALLTICIAMIPSFSNLEANDFRRFDAQKNTNYAPGTNEYSNFVAKTKDASPAANKKADNLRQKTILSINSLTTNKAVQGNQRFELMMRLGETHIERHDYLRKLEFDLYDRNYENWERSVRKIYRKDPKAPKEKYPREPLLDETQSQLQLTKAANAFRKVVAEFPKHPRGDEALFLLAQTLTRLNNDNAVKYLHDLDKRYPKSRLIPDTFLALGENYFAKGDIKQSINYYSKATKFKTHPAYPYAVYKLGWSYYNAGAENDSTFRKYMKKASKAFRAVVKLSTSKKYNTGRIDLQDEALNDLVMVWAETEEIETAWRYFRKLNKKDKFYSMLERMGNIYVDQGKNNKAIQVYTRLLKESPLRENNPLIYEKLVALYEATQNLKKVVETLKTMQNLYVGKTVWLSKFGRDKELRSETTELIVNGMQHYGTKFHDLGQRTNQKNLLAAAADIYDAYLKTFSKTKEAYDLRFYLAEILFGFEKFDEASGHYLIVSNQKGDYLNDAAMNAVIASTQHVEKQNYKSPGKLGTLKKSKSIPLGMKKQIVTFDNYAKLLPQNEQGIPMRYSAADTFFTYGHYKEAIKRFELIMTVAPLSKQAENAVKLVLGFHAENKRWNDVIRSSQKYEKNKTLLTNADIQPYIVARLKQAIFSSAKDYEKAKKHKDAAKTFIFYADRFPKDENADRSLYNASLNYYKIGALNEALKVSLGILKKYPTSKLTPEVTAKIATTYESIANFPMAADMYAELAKLPQAMPEKRATALFNAGVLYKGLKKYNQSMASFEQYLKDFNRGPQALEALKELAETSEAANSLAKAASAYASYAKSARTMDERLYAQAKSATISLQLKRSPENIAYLAKLGERLSKDDKNPAYDARYAVAKNMFEIVQRKIDIYKKTPLRNGARIEQEIAVKNKALQSIAKDLEKVIAVGNAELAVASLYGLGELHEQLAKDLFKAPPPKGASTEVINNYRSSLEKAAFPLREEANKFYVSAYKRSKEIRSFTPWSKKTRSKMAEIEPAKFEKVTTESAKPSYLGHQLYLKGAVKDLADE